MNVSEALNTIWFPCSQMKDYEDFPPLMINNAQGSYLYSENDKPIIDAISSWWCKSLGHRHPEVQQSIKQQLDKFEHIIGTNTVSDALLGLSKQLAQIQPGLDKVFYTGDGSCAVEVAMKMSLHSRKILSQSNRSKFASLVNSYHGETLAALSVSDVGLYKKPYLQACFDCTHLGPLPYVQGENDPLWHDASEYWPSIEAQLDKQKHELTAIIIEPILQGAGGMNIYSADLLKKLSHYAKANDIHIIADEIMTGFGRTGKTLACEHAGITPDFICLSKGLTGGNIAMSAILTSTECYELFYDDYETSKAFLHSNTYGGNALAAAVANKVVEIHFRDNMNHQAEHLGQNLLHGMLAVAEQTQVLSNIRQIGAMVAADLTIDRPRAGFEVFKHAVKLGAFLRPLGNTLYWLPPLNTPSTVIEQLEEITTKAIHATINT